MNGFGEDGVSGRLQSKKYLSEALAMLAFTAGCQHAAVNFPQLTHMSYAPNAPFTTLRPLPTGPVDTWPALEPEDYLPPRASAVMQQHVMSV